MRHPRSGPLGWSKRGHKAWIRPPSLIQAPHVHAPAANTIESTKPPQNTPDLGDDMGPLNDLDDVDFQILDRFLHQTSDPAHPAIGDLPPRKKQPETPVSPPHQGSPTSQSNQLNNQQGQPSDSVNDQLSALRDLMDSEQDYALPNMTGKNGKPQLNKLGNIGQKRRPGLANPNETLTPAAAEKPRIESLGQSSTSPQSQNPLEQLTSSGTSATSTSEGENESVLRMAFKMFGQILRIAGERHRTYVDQLDQIYDMVMNVVYDDSLPDSEVYSSIFVALEHYENGSGRSDN